MNLPPFPESYIPASPEERLRWVQWGKECARMGAEAERSAKNRGRQVGWLTQSGSVAAPVEHCAHEARLYGWTPVYARADEGDGE